MYCVVYQLRQRGEKLPPDIVRQRPVEGYLVFDKRGGWPVHDAKLFDKRGSTREILPALKHASTVKIDNGIMLRGLEDAGYQKHHQQAWWVLPGLMDDTTIKS